MSGVLAAQPNAFDLARLARALESRRRYRYVSPRVVGVADGYRVVSPCCSRNVDAEGGEIDVARLHWDGPRAVWRLMWKDHARGAWELHSLHARLDRAAATLATDPERLFWP
jgi:hypothetical protein